MLRNVICLLTFLLIGISSSAQEYSSPVVSLKSLYDNDKEFQNTVDLMLANVHELPNGDPNPWKGKNVGDLYDFLNDWFFFLPNTHNGLDRILEFSFLYFKNPNGMKFILSEPGLNWSLSFIEERGKFMDSPESAKIIGI